MKLGHMVTVLVAAATVGCMATYRVSPQEYVAQHNPAQILVLDATGAVYLVESPAVKGDTLVGMEFGTPDTVALPLSQVEDALVKHRSTGKTAALVGGLAAGVGMAVVAIMTQGSDNPCRTGNNKSN